MTDLPFTPEPLECLQTRLGAALTPVYWREHMEAGDQPWPHTVPAQVFDWPDGLRGIVYREHEDGATHLHCVATCARDTPLAALVRQRLVWQRSENILLKWFIPLIQSHWAALAPHGPRLYFHYFGCDDGAAHLFDYARDGDAPSDV